MPLNSSLEKLSLQGDVSEGYTENSVAETSMVQPDVSKLRDRSRARTPRRPMPKIRFASLVISVSSVSTFALESSAAVNHPSIVADVVGGPRSVGAGSDGVGSGIGDGVGSGVGGRVEEFVGGGVGDGVGGRVEEIVGDGVGTGVGPGTGGEVGTGVGGRVEEIVGDNVGSGVGGRVEEIVGEGVGTGVGPGTGGEVGSGIGSVKAGDRTLLTSPHVFE